VDPHHFDTLTKSLASGLSRRKALTRLGGGGAAALLAAAAGRDRLAAAPATAPSTTCTLSLDAHVRLGPSAGQVLRGTAPGELRGQLSFALDAQGAITQGQLSLGDGTVIPVVGQASGRALNLRLAFGSQQAIVAIGTAEQDLTTCQGAVDGLLTGPQAGDLGDWHATATAAGPPAPGGQSGGAVVTVVSGTGGATGGQPTAAAGRPTGQAGGPPTPGPGGCAAGTTECTGACVNLQTDPANCGGCGFGCPAGISCVGAICCNPGKAPCTNDKYCCDGPCVNGFCQPAGGGPSPTTPACPTGQAYCNGACIPIYSDTNNCGSCGNTCPSGIPCVGGSCTCPPALAVCGGKCTDTTSDSANCGTCGNACPGGQTCKQSICQ